MSLARNFKCLNDIALQSLPVLVLFFPYSYHFHSLYLKSLLVSLVMLLSVDSSFPGKAKEGLEIEAFPLQAACALETGLDILVYGPW